MILIDGRPLQTYSRFRGIGRYTKSLIDTFKNDERFFFLFFRGNDLNLKNSVFINSPKKFITFTDNLFLKNLLKEHNFKVFHSTGYAVPKKPLKIKKILTVYDLTPLLFPSFFSIKHKFIFKKILSSGKFADLIITISSSTKRDLLKFFPEFRNKVEIVYPFISQDFCTSSKNNALIETPDKYFLFVGGADLIKNIETILKAIEIVKLPLVITGTFSYKDKKAILKKYQKLEKLIHFTGFLENKKLMQIYKNSIALLYPSLNEGFGYPPLEALKCNTVSIVSKNGSLPEVLKNNAIYLENPLNHKELAERMMALAENPSIKNDYLKGKEKLLLSYSIDKFKEKILSIYKLLDNN